jgi:pSer/pThr/pTyr-binding forkhead associated (FHA) protein
MQAQLIPVDGGEPITLKRDITIVGRKSGLCDFVVDRSSISKLHCVIIKTDGLLYIRDLASTNGTRVNGQKVTRGALLPGDELSFASVKYRVHLGPGEAEYGADEATEMLTDPPSEPIFEDEDSDSDVQLLPDDSVV